MTITTTGPLSYTNLGVKGIVPQDPDGLFSGRLLYGGDASGGTATGRFVLSTGGISGAPVDVVLKLHYMHIANLNASNSGVAMNLQMTSLGPFTGPAGLTAGWQIGLDTQAVLGSHIGTLSPLGGWTWPSGQHGHYNWIQKGTNTVYLAVTCTNLDVQNTWFNLVVQGSYWYMGPRRLEAMERLRTVGLTYARR